MSRRVPPDGLSSEELLAWIEAYLDEPLTEEELAEPPLPRSAADIRQGEAIRQWLTYGMLLDDAGCNSPGGST